MSDTEDGKLVKDLLHFRQDYYDMEAKWLAVVTERDALEATIERLRADMDFACTCAEGLVVMLAGKNFPDVKCTPSKGDLAGLLTQIDNIASVLAHPSTARSTAFREAAEVARGTPARLGYTADRYYYGRKACESVARVLDAKAKEDTQI